jgi:hypothetical protein
MGRDCNELYGRLYENVAAPILKPMATRSESCHLSPSDQLIVGQWIFIKVFLGLLSQIEPGSGCRGFAQGACRYMQFPAFGPFPPMLGVSIRIGTYEPMNPPVEGFSTELCNVGPLPPNHHHSVGVMGYFCWEFVVAEPEFVGPLVAACPDNDLMVRIWPPNKAGVDWPPERVMMSGDLEALRQAWDAAEWPPPPGAPPSSERAFVKKSGTVRIRKQPPKP